MEQKNIQQKWKDPKWYQQKSRVLQHAEVAVTKMLVTMLSCLLVLSPSYSTVAGSATLTQMPSSLFYLAYVCSVLSLTDLILFLCSRRIFNFSLTLCAHILHLLLLAIVNPDNLQVRFSVRFNHITIT
jgi:uncharacterized membrane protein